ncbi:MAG: helicase-related protein [Chitinophagaceae bacterium]
MSTKFFTNEGGNSLFKKFTGAFEHIANMHAFHAVVGYFRASGYFPIRNHLLKVPEVKILVGIDVDKVSAEAKKRGLLFFGDPERSRDEFVKWMRQDIQEAKYDKEIENGILLFMDDIINKRVEIRIHRTKKLHAKIYIFLPEKFNEYSGGEVITGSSNLTESGLGIKEDANYEFNVCLRDYEEVNFAEKEFQKLWEQGEEVLPFDVERIKKNSHIGQLYTPFEIYIKLLIEYFGKNIDYDPDSVGDLPKNFKKLSYQVDAVNQGYQMLLDHNGFMLADVVGLGKTIIATMIAKRFLISNGTLNTKILVVYPPHLERNWKSTFRQFGIDKHARFVSNGSLHKILDTTNEDYWRKEDYDLILVDEAHKFRNHKSRMFNDLQTICKTNRSVEGNVFGLRKKIILISATPLNNRPEDIYYQLQLFTDARKSTLTVTNLQAFFAPLIRRYKEIMAASRVSSKPDTEGLRKIYSLIREKILMPITVRRTRKDVDSYKDYKKDLIEQGISFPEIAPPRSIEYKMDKDLESLFYHTIGLLVNEIGYYRYRAIEFLHPDIQDLYYTQGERASRNLAFIMMTQLVKRLESSFHAFKISLNRFRISTERMIEMFANNKVYVAPDANINDMIDKGWDEEDIDSYIMELSEDNPRNQIFTAENFNPSFINKLEEDFVYITDICHKWEPVHDDPKWERFAKLLKNELLRTDINPSGKLVIFSESKETVKYLQQKMQKEGYEKLLTVSADNRKSMHDTILQNFDANFAGEFANDIDFIITTEVLAEGINLHRANMLVNYDTPWNATKLMQRIGRVNRIGSTHTIFNYSFYPSRQSDDLINLYNNAFIKLQSFHSAYGEDSKIYTPEEVLEQVKLHEKGLPEDEDRRLRYLEFIRQFKEKNEKEFKRIARLPMRARTARDSEEAKKKGVKESSLVFLKSDYKMEFYKVATKQTEPLSFVEAAELFEATVHETAEKLPDYHHEQVYRAVLKFEEELLAQNTDTASGEQADALTNRSKKFIRGEYASSTDEKFRQACERLLDLLDKGTYTNLATEVNKIRLKFDKNQLTEAKAHNLILTLAVKFAETPADDDDETAALVSELPIEIADEPDIIISETFVP